MDASVKKLWIQALRSGKYTQGRDFLKKRDSDNNAQYCCLGVLCELALAVGVVESTNWYEFDNTTCYYKDSEGYSDSHWPTPKVRNWAGLTLTQITELGSMNDSRRMTFEQIAEYIEENL